MQLHTRVLAVGGLALFAVGCSSVADQAAEQVAEEVAEQALDGAEINVEDGGIEIQTPEGNMSIDESGDVVIEGADGELVMSGGQEIPEDMPEVPMFTGATITGTSRIDTGTDINWTVSGEVEEPQVSFEALVGELEAGGWTIEGQGASESPSYTGFVTATSGDLTLNASVSAGEPNAFSLILTQTPS